MPKFIVTSPDGKEYEVNAPEGASQEDAITYIQGIVAQQPQEKPEVPEYLKVDRPEQNWSNLGANSADDAGIKRPYTTPEYLSGIAMASAPFSDEIGGALGAAAKSAVNGKSFVENYDDAERMLNRTQDRFRANHPYQNIASGVPNSLLVTSIMGRMPWVPILQSAAGGAIQGIDNGRDINSRISNGFIGGAVGGLTGLLLKGAEKAINPKVDKQVQLLRDEGVRMTPGQIMGNVAKKTEDIATSIPLTGDFIAARQSDSIKDMNRAVANRALHPIGDKLPSDISVGRNAVAYVKRRMSQAYDTVLSRMSASPDMEFAKAISDIKDNAAKTLPDQQMGMFDKIVNREIWEKAAKNYTGNSGNFGKILLDGETLKGIESELHNEIKGYASGTWNEQQLAGFLGDVKDAFRNMLSRQNGTLYNDLRNVDNAYANYAILRKAASAKGAENGVFTPAMLIDAVKGADYSAGKGAFSSGTARMSDLADAAYAKLPSKFPDSGTARRVVMQGSVTGGITAGSLVNPSIAIPIGTAIGASSGAYTRTGNRLLQALLTAPRTAAARSVANTLSTANPYISGTLPFLLMPPALSE